MAKPKEEKPEISEEEQKLLDEGMVGILKDMKNAKPQRSKFWGVLDRLNTADEDLLLKTSLPKPRPVGGWML